jgi:hypothetical protein
MIKYPEVLIKHPLLYSCSWVSSPSMHTGDHLLAPPRK